MMTTTIATPRQGSPPHRTRRKVIAALAGSVLIVSIGLGVNQVVDSAPVSRQAPNARELYTDVATPAVIQPAVAAPEGRFVIDDAASIACGSGFADVCHYTFTWLQSAPAVTPSTRLVINEASLEACGLGHGDACPFAYTWVSGPELSSAAAAEVCRGGLEWACAFTRELVSQN
jgi:hypothetical protein